MAGCSAAFEKDIQIQQFWSVCNLYGVFCGFPMGAKVVSDLYGAQKLSKSEANTLLAFCNNGSDGCGCGGSFFGGGSSSGCGCESIIGSYSFCAAAAMVTVMADVVSATSVADAAVARATDAGAGFGFCFFCAAAATATVAADVGITMAVAAANF